MSNLFCCSTKVVEVWRLGAVVWIANGGGDPLWVVLPLDLRISARAGFGWAAGRGWSGVVAGWGGGGGDGAGRG